MVKNFFSLPDTATPRFLMIGMILFTGGLGLVSLALGRYGIPLSDLGRVLAWKIGILPAASVVGLETVETVLFAVRLPRVLSALLVGAALSVSGATYQGLFKNPMVSPDILGASAGAGFGAALAILFGFNGIAVQFAAFVCGIAAVAVTYWVSGRIGGSEHGVLTLVLTGMVMGALFSAFIALTKYVADPDNKLPAITFWLMGGLSSVTWKEFYHILIPMALGILPVMLLRWRLNVLSFGEEEAQALGINTRQMRFVLIAGSTLLTAAAVSIGGLIGWVGLVIPHLARMVVGPDFRRLLLAALLMGGAFMMVVDDLSRTLFAIEIPLGILTALIGAPFFIHLLARGKRGWL